MRNKLLAEISCPKVSKKAPCLGRLEIIKAKKFSARPGEISEGFLKCALCGQVYPVLAGIPILLDDLGTFLRHNYHFIKGASRKLGFFDIDMDRFFFMEMMSAYKDKKEKLRPAQVRYSRKTLRDSDRSLASYLANHYDRLEKVVKEGEPFRGFIADTYHPTPHEILEKFLGRYIGKKTARWSLDIGCNVGGMSARLAGMSENVLGVDLSFYNLLNAYGIVKSLPKRITSYRLLGEPNQFKRRKIDQDPKENVDFILASGTNLPLKNNKMDVVLSCNVIDIIDKPKKLLEEKMRVAKMGGMVLSSDPYQFFAGLRDGPKGVDKGNPKTKIFRILKDKMKVLDERENTLWLSRNYNRSYMVYFNHSFCAKKIRS